ncbi:MAG: NADH:flavin oxidoreductase/NADH oxidase [Mycolicibacterium cosmeticum]|nr:NADH:flavin oxidoreductase/NADH oxidase [Mycolicibacterium cosmeticum]
MKHSETIGDSSALFQPITLRSVEIPNRVMVSPMCQYSAGEGGAATDYHLVQIGRYALGGFGLVVVEATAVTPEGRITHGDLGLWSDQQTAGLARMADFLSRHGSVPGIQLGHAGPKASAQKPWEGNGPLGMDDAARGALPWQIVSVSSEPAGPGWPAPAALDVAAIHQLIDAYAAAARRAREAGFRYLEIHAAHGYLLHSFLSPLTNTRADEYGGSRQARQRFLLEVTSAIRSVWPSQYPLGVRISAVDGVAGAIDLTDTVSLSRELKQLGVDIIDCSSGGVGGAYQQPIDLGFQVPFAEAVRQHAEIATVAVGLILEPNQAEQIIAAGRADIVAIAREALVDPNWAVKARLQLQTAERSFDHWHPQAAWWLQGRERLLRKLGIHTRRRSLDHSTYP